jgi:hydrogenase maturation protease
VGDAVRTLADAVLYEGYVLWPYRRSALKNRQRWTFGGVYPSAWSRAHPDDRSTVAAECLLVGDEARVEVCVRFLQIVRRTGGDFLPWDEARERELTEPGRFEIPAGEEREGGLLREWEALGGEFRVEREGDLIRVRVTNTTRWEGLDREDAQRRAFCSLHAILRVENGAFVSPLDPAAAECRNEGLWPCLVGEPPARDTMLASPIILDEYPRVAPESPGDLFDAGEIDELLILNVLALTEEEREEVRASDPRARELLERCERLSPQELMRLHGVIR